MNPQEKSPTSAWKVMAFIAAHVPLALAARSSPTVATVHLVLVAAAALVVAVHDARPDRPALIGAYIVGSEVFWRMTGGAVFWEGAKYLVAGTLLVAGMRLRGVRGTRGALLYVALLLPSCLITFSAMNYDLARSEVSFYLSGPLVLGISAWFFSRVTLDRNDLRLLTVAFVGPVMAVYTLAFVGSEKAEIAFTVSNIDTSGGFGPNQVSALLGLAAMLAFLRLVEPGQERLPTRIGFGALMVLFGLQSALTFSRGGLYGAAAGIGAFVLLVSADRRARLRVLAGAVALVVISESFLFPWLQTRTGGAVAERFADTGTTGRDSMAVREMEAFLADPVLGLGPGGGNDIRIEGRHIASHTEYTRMLAEHGVFGLVALLLLLRLALDRLRASSSSVERARSAAFFVWSAVFLMHAAMRLALPGFFFGLAMARGAPGRRSTTPSIGPPPATRGA